MTLNIGSSLAGGISRVANRNGLLLLVAYLLIGAAWQIPFYSAVVTGLEQSGTPTGNVALPAIDAPLAVSVSAAILLLLGLQWLTIVTIRTFVGGHTQEIPSEYYTRNIVPVVLNSLVGGLIYAVLMLVGSVLFVIPGIIAYVAFIFTLVYVAVEDKNFIAGFRNSWQLTRGHWLRLFGLLLVVVAGIGLISGVLTAMTSLVVGAIAGEGIGILLSGVVGLPFSLLILATLAEAFTQLRESQKEMVTS
ncbi:hypothetical protein PN416_14995 [Halorubrum ezzemoulense]|uniref:hypothetical protein n=1 Tax=Halorubrum ezzemoulense TaxID=337243 RepID=UPI0023314640|nr:hypothetical protein [Halorubrum ezzemoulense]MDB9281286.1 hypothetical protein [Halorubrum ezzemoulense]MDB9284717.1 hypothetical protein [Halorubrum ezzemoulense]